ncbi:MAG: class I SAM-dependent methyltransferase [Bacillota bacterium]|nr:class I SAM-dependent methyltransferase [Bacillota bacterium]
MITLTERLRTITEMLIEGEPLADIGADHAQLSLFLLENQMVNQVIIGELGDGPYQRACEAVQNSGYSERIDVRQGDGLQVLANDEVSTVVLAGMGGETICQILSFDRAKAGSIKRFVFQPMTKADVLRRFLSSWGWKMIDEQVVREKEHVYVIIIAQPDHKPYMLTEVEQDIGPIILKADTESKRDFILEWLNIYRKRYRGILLSNSLDKQQQVILLKSQIEELEAILNASSC